ncbi:hypothetical protein [Haliangium sp.]|uniref:hypothetical protein n=1 Tax=Haliangium sp. TaxID=2663208 RepID=UPI003D0D8FE0
MSRLPAPPGRLRALVRVGFLLLTFLGICHYNLVRPHLLHGQRNIDTAATPSWARGPAAAYNGLTELATKIGMSGTWRMYSPVPRSLRRTEWRALHPDGHWVPLSAPDLPPSYRRERPLAAALWWDFKRARVHDNYFLTRAEPWLPRLFILASRDAIVRELGWMPVAVEVQVRAAAIPAPADKGDWHPSTARFDDLLWKKVYR